MARTAIPLRREHLRFQELSRDEAQVRIRGARIRNLDDAR
jgi:hypothetical protein